MVGVEVVAVVVARDGWIEEGGVCNFLAAYSSRLVSVLCITHFWAFTIKISQTHRYHRRDRADVRVLLP